MKMSDRGVSAVFGCAPLLLIRTMNVVLEYSGFAVVAVSVA